MRRLFPVPLAVLLFLLPLTSCAETDQETAEAPREDVAEETADSLVLVTPDDLTWTEGRVPDEAVAVLYGNPAGTGDFAVRVRFPPDHHVPAHTHPETEFATVLEGTVYAATGEGATRDDAEPYPSGSFVAFPAGTVISAWTGEDGALIQVHGQAPFETQYLEE
jgi:quercetin dioxygenase-like cupin family protein